MYFYIEPEVSGSLGDKSIADMTVHPPRISKLDYLFEGWLGDDLLETFPCYIVSENLKMEITDTDLTGFSLDVVDVSRSEQFDELYPERELPAFYWLKIIGKAGKDDFGIADDYRLVISEKALAILKRCKIDQADMEAYI